MGLLASWSLWRSPQLGFVTRGIALAPRIRSRGGAFTNNLFSTMYIHAILTCD